LLGVWYLRNDLFHLAKSYINPSWERPKDRGGQQHKTGKRYKVIFVPLSGFMLPDAIPSASIAEHLLRNSR
jgi:hypothetical protein